MQTQFIVGGTEKANKGATFAEDAATAALTGPRDTFPVKQSPVLQEGLCWQLLCFTYTAGVAKF